MAASLARADTDPRLKTFAAQKHKQAEELAAKLHLDVPAEVREFFRAAEAGDWIAVSNSFDRIRPVAGTNGPLPGLNNVLFVLIHETWGAYAEFDRWDATMLQKFADGILHSIPADSVYFGGTGSGRFVITTVRDVAKSPDIFVVSQNPFGTSFYAQYLGLSYGSRIWIPSEKDEQAAFQQYVEDMRTADAKSPGGQMDIIGRLTKMVFDHNKDTHEFYVEESFVIPWMYPHLEPHGLIMKLNKEPLATFNPKVVAQDRQFWDALTKELLGNRHFTENTAARMTFSKLRSAIGGLYSYRHLTDEAESVFKQAMELGPTSPEASFRLAQLYLEVSRYDDAVAVLEQFQKRLNAGGLDWQRTGQAIAQFREMKRRMIEQESKTNSTNQSK